MFQLKKNECGNYLVNNIDADNSCIIQKFNNVFRLSVIDNGLHISKYFKLNKHRYILLDAKNTLEYNIFCYFIEKFNITKNSLMSL